MSTSLKERFREVDRIPSPWDGPPGTPEQVRRPRRSYGPILAASAAAAAIAVAIVVSARSGAPNGDASWLTGPAQASCVEQYSPDTLAQRSWAFEGVITDVHGPADPDSPDPADMTTTIRFDVVKWFWGGAGAEASRRTYSVASSAGALDASIGARLLVSGDEDFVWSCGFTQPVTERGRSEFEAAASGRQA